MIVNTMTPQEKYKEIENDYPALYERLAKERDRTRRAFLKATLFPISHLVQWKSGLNNLWTAFIVARTRSDRKDPGFVTYIKYETVGIGALSVRIFKNEQFCFDFRPHFFKRYRERFLIPNGIENLSIDEQVRHFFLNCGMFQFDLTQDSGKIVIYIDNGVLLGDIDTKLRYVYVKTYVSSDLFYKLQRETSTKIELANRKIFALPDYMRRGHMMGKTPEGDLIDFGE